LRISPDIIGQTTVGQTTVGQVTGGIGKVDVVVIVGFCALSLLAGLLLSRRSARHGAEGFFTGNRSLPWWAIGVSNTATYQSGNGAFVMLVLSFGLAGNWLWWASWIIWMPLVALIWAPMWRRMQIVTTAELISLRYGGEPARIARKIYAAVCCCGFSVLLVGYITGFFAKTVAPLLPISETQTLLIFGGITVLYTLFGGLLGVVVTDVLQFIILLVGSTIFLWLAMDQHGGWSAILERVASVRSDALAQTPPTPSIETLTLLILIVQGFFFAGSPTAGEGMTAQRFMAAKSERHAIGGQLFNAFLALTVRTLPLIGLGLVAMSLFWTSELAESVGPAPAGMTTLSDPAYAWAELVKRCTLPAGLVGLLIATEVAAYMSTLSALINWGTSFVVNDLYEASKRGKSKRSEIWISRIATLLLFVAAAAIAILFVEGMIGWFLFINSAMVIFLLPLAWFRFFWWRFNVWGELAAIVLGLPLSIVVWFVLGFKDRPAWQGLGLLLVMSFVVLTVVTLLTPPERKEVLRGFYQRCRPPGLWGPVRETTSDVAHGEPSTAKLVIDSSLGILSCLGLVLATNALFVKDWTVLIAGLAGCVGFGAWLLTRVFDRPVVAERAACPPQTDGTPVTQKCEI